MGFIMENIRVIGIVYLIGAIITFIGLFAFFTWAAKADAKEQELYPEYPIEDENEPFSLYITVVFIISIIPILELRGALLVACPILGVPVAKAIPLCILGNIIPVPFILLLITPIFNWMKGTKHLKPLVDKLEAKAMKKKDQIEKYEFWGLVLFVGIPLPGTGAWTGSLIAALLGVKFKKAFPAVIIGICMATVIMWFISYVLLGGVQILG